MREDVRWAIIIVIFMTTTSYLNQEVPMCIDNPSQANIPSIINESVVQELNEQIQSNTLIFQTSGQSMKPVITDNQRCACVMSDTYQVGDIIVFFAEFPQGIEAIAHQIIGINGEEITTKGVNNNFTDGTLKVDNILCKIPTVKRYELWTK